MRALDELLARAADGECILVSLKDLADMVTEDRLEPLERIFAAWEYLKQRGAVLSPDLANDDLIFKRGLTLSRMGRGAGSTAARKLIADGEGEQVEFKATLLHPTAVLEHPAAKALTEDEMKFQVVKAVAGFLNHRGGSVFIGVNDDGKLRGVEEDFDARRPDIDVWQRALVDVLNANLEPRPTGLLEVSCHVLDGKTVVRVHVEARGPRLTYAKDPRGEWQILVRSAAMSRKLTLKEVEDVVITRLQMWNVRG